MPSLQSLKPERVIPGARLALAGRDLPVPASADASITMGGVPCRIVLASTTETVVEVPADLEGGATEVKAAWLPGAALVAQVGRRIAHGLHQVDSPVCDASGRVYVTYSGSRGQEVPVSIFRVTRDGAREPFASGIANPTSLAIGPDGHLYVSSRFEGTVYRVFDDGRYEVVASDLGVACGVTFGADGALYVGDRTGTIFRIDGDRVFRLATVPSSIAAFHLAMHRDGHLYVAAPTLAPRDPLYRVDANGVVEKLDVAFGRPQGLAFDARGDLHVAEALAGAGGIYRWREGGAPELVVAGPNIVGLTFAPDDRLIVATSDAVYRF